MPVLELSKRSMIMEGKVWIIDKVCIQYDATDDDATLTLLGWHRDGGGAVTILDAVPLPSSHNVKTIQVGCYNACETIQIKINNIEDISKIISLDLISKNSQYPRITQVI